MVMTFEEALEYLRTHSNPRERQYHEACAVIARNLDKLAYRIFFRISTDMMSDTSTEWDEVRAASKETCGCGNEREFVPLTMRHEFRAAGDSITVHDGEKVYIRPVGAPASAAYTMLRVIGDEDFLEIMSDPCSPSMDFSLLFSRKGYGLNAIADVIAKQPPGQPAVLARKVGDIDNVPILVIQSVDPVALTVTIVLDEAVEAFDPDTEEQHQH